MADIPSKAFATQLGMGTTSTINERFEFVSCSLAGRVQTVQSPGIRGTRSRYHHRSRKSSEAPSGSIVMNPSVTEIDRMLPRILGGNTSGGVTDVADVPPSFWASIDRVQKVHTYTGCVVDRAQLSGSPGQPMQLALDIEATAETEAAAGSFPVLSIDTQDMFIFADLTVTIGGVVVPVASLTVTWDNQLEKNRFMNSLTRAVIPALDRVVTLEVQLPYNPDTHALYTSLEGGSEVAGIVAMSDGTTTYTIDFGTLVSNVVGPEIGSKASELFLPLTFEAFRTATASESKFTKT